MASLGSDEDSRRNVGIDTSAPVDLGRSFLDRSRWIEEGDSNRTTEPFALLTGPSGVRGVLRTAGPIEERL